MDLYEVTNAQYKKFVDATGHNEPEGYEYIKGSWRSGFKPWSNPNFNGNDQPVVCVSWEDAKAYAEWAGKRLPTEAEWEKSARGNLTATKYPWGDILTHDDANYSDTDGLDKWKYTSPVGKFQPNGYGLYDMAGNVWEWCADRYDGNYYAVSPKQNPTGPNVENSKVLRGGGWILGTQYSLRVTERLRPNSQVPLYNVGFRCVKDVTK